MGFQKVWGDALAISGLHGIYNQSAACLRIHRVRFFFCPLLIKLLSRTWHHVMHISQPLSWCRCVRKNPNSTGECLPVLESKPPHPQNKQKESSSSRRSLKASRNEWGEKKRREKKWKTTNNKQQVVQLGGSFFVFWSVTEFVSFSFFFSPKTSFCMDNNNNRDHTRSWWGLWGSSSSSHTKRTSIHQR